MSDSASVGSLVHAVLLMAVVERAFETSGFDERIAYVSGPDPRRDIGQAIDRLGPLLQGAPDGRSVMARNAGRLSAYALHRPGYPPAAARMAGMVTELPWIHTAGSSGEAKHAQELWRTLV